MTKIKPSFYLVIGGILMLAVAGVIWFSTGGELPFEKITALRPVHETDSKIDSKTLSPQALEIKKRINQTDKKVGDLVSDYDDFTITYLISNDEYLVTIKKSPFKDSKKKAEGWFLNQGFAKRDLCFLKITFVPVKNVEFSSPDDAHPTDCLR